MRRRAPRRVEARSSSKLSASDGGSGSSYKRKAADSKEAATEAAAAAAAARHHLRIAEAVSERRRRQRQRRRNRSIRSSNGVRSRRWGEEVIMQCYVGEMTGRRTSLNLSEEAEGTPMETIERLAGENAVVVFSVSSCCMCHVVKSLFCSLGVNPTVYELDEEMNGQQLKEALARLVGEGQPVPAVFVGGKLVGGLDRVMAAHISGALVPLLKEAGALWL